MSSSSPTWRSRSHAIATLRRGIALCREVDDIVTRHLLEQILTSEEEHIDYLETQLSLMKGLGEQEYLSLQVGSLEH